MKTASKWLAGIIVLYLVLMLGTGLAIKFLLPGSAGDRILAAVESRAPVSVAVGNIDFDLWQWFFFKPAIALEEVTVSNPEGFSSEPLLAADSISSQVALLSLFEDHIDVRSFSLVRPRLRIERNSQGVTNLQTVADAIGSNEEDPQPSSSAEASGAWSVDGFYLEEGSIHYIPAPGEGPSEPLRIEQMNARLVDFSPDSTCRMTFEAAFFDGPESKLMFEGRAGPFEAKSVPAQGDLSLVLAPSEFPDSYRAQYLGDLLREPGDESRLTFTTVMDGDLLGVFEGNGKLSLASVQLGEIPESRLPLNGEAPLELVIRDMITNPRFDASIADATLQLGAGTWQGRAEVSFDGERFQGGSRGAIQGADINELVTCFTSAKDVISGHAEITEYQIGFSGRDAAEIQDSLSGNGALKVEQGHVALFDLLQTIEKHVKKVLRGETPQEGRTNFARLFTRFQIENQKLNLTELMLENPSLNVTGGGYIGFNKELNLDLSTTVIGDTALLLGGKADSSGQPRATVPVDVRGTLDSPKVRPDIRQVVKDKIKEGVTGLLDSLFKKPQ